MSWQVSDTNHYQKFPLVVGFMMKKSSGGGGRLRTDQHLLEENQRLKARIRELEQSVTASGQPVNVLSDGEARYRELIENSHDIIYTVNPTVYLPLCPKAGRSCWVIPSPS